MGKRSNYKRVPRDFYPTPPEAVLPLIPQLSCGDTFCEPCAGDGALVSALRLHGMSCVSAMDIEPRADSILQFDALTESFGHHLDGCKWIITNPPWSREILHRMIERFSDIRPTWLLFDADWVHTRQSAPFMERCRKIVSVGRLKWIPDSEHTGKDNCAWYLFDRSRAGPTEFVGRQVQ